MNVNKEIASSIKGGHIEDLKINYFDLYESVCHRKAPLSYLYIQGKAKHSNVRMQQLYYRNKACPFYKID